MSKEQADAVFSLSIELLRKTLAEDKTPGSYYYVWQSNIAMAFMDEYEVAYKLGNIEHQDIHEIANKAAKRFLDSLIGDVNHG